MSATDFWNNVVEGYVAKGPGGIGGEPGVGWNSTIQLATAQHNGKASTNGDWYTLVFNNNDQADWVSSGCESLNTWQWEQAGATGFEPKVNPTDLAKYALARIHVQRPDVHTNPSGDSEVNLATFVIVTPPTGAAADGEVHVDVEVPATGQEVTVALTPHSVSISPGAGFTAYNSCGPDGSTEQTSEMNSTGPGVAPDCGVLYQQPSTGAGTMLTVTQNWTAVAYQGPFVAGAANTLLPAGEQNVQSPPFTKAITVREIQSSNGG